MSNSKSTVHSRPLRKRKLSIYELRGVVWANIAIVNILWASVLELCLSRTRAQPSPRDREMRRVSWKLANCHATNSAETTCTTNPEQIEVIKLEGYSGTMHNDCKKMLNSLNMVLEKKSHV